MERKAGPKMQRWHRPPGAQAWQQHRFESHECLHTCLGKTIHNCGFKHQTGYEEIDGEGLPAPDNWLVDWEVS